jgi:translation initiation factor 2B subunit (eIF-2B alpha/beta/delta family)
MLSDKDLRDIINSFITSLQRKQIKGTYHIGRATAEILRTIVSNMSKRDTIQKVIDQCRLVAVKLKRQQPTMLVISNIVRRVLYVIRDEFVRNSHKVHQAQETHQPNLANLLEAKAEVDFTKPVETGMTFYFTIFKQ